MKDEERPAAEALDGGRLLIRVPLPYSLKWVNAYLLPEPDGGWTLIDPGLRDEETENFWSATLRERRIGWEDVRRIVVTHHHPDHYGMAGWFQRRTGATVWTSRVAEDNAERLWGAGETFSDELTGAFVRHGLAPGLVPAMREHLSGFAGRTSPRPEDVRFLAPGDSFAMGGVEWKVYGGEGHGPGHLLFHDPKSGDLICGDQVLPDISPNVGWMPGGDPDPLLSFLESLRKLRELEVGTAYPGHRKPYGDFRGRIDELLDHHERRMRRMAELIGGESPDASAGRSANGEAKTAFEICELTFGTRLRGNIHNLRFALAETIAHLVRMEALGTIERTETASSILYGLART